MENNIGSATELPYFEGDFWPNVLEESIKELDQEEEEKRRREEEEAAAAEQDTTEVEECDMSNPVSTVKKRMALWNFLFELQECNLGNKKTPSLTEMMYLHNTNSKTTLIYCMILIEKN